MTDVASKDLCEELYKLSGWVTANKVTSFKTGTYYEYTLGYLLRKLPSKIEDKYATEYNFGLWKLDGKHEYSAGYTDVDNGLHNMGKTFKSGDTPEDAVAKLCIELIKQKVITP